METSKITARFFDQKNRECLSKRTYRSEAEAERQAGMEARRTGKEMRPYRCRFCKKWHLATERVGDDDGTPQAGDP